MEKESLPRRATRIVFGFAFLFSLLGACAGTPPNTPMPSASPVDTKPLPQDSKESPKEIVLRAQQAFNAMPGYQAEMRAFQKKDDKTGYAAYDVNGKPPQKIRLIIKEGNSVGTKLFWNGGKKVKVRPAGLLSLLVVELDTSDSKLVSTRGYRIDQTDLKSILGMLSDPQANFLYTGKGSGYYRLIVSSPHLLAGCVKMDMLLDEKTMLLHSVDMSDSKEIVFRMSIHNLRVTPNVSFDI